MKMCLAQEEKCPDWFIRRKKDETLFLKLIKYFEPER